MFVSYQGKQETHKHQKISRGREIHQTWQVSQMFSLSVVSGLLYYYNFNRFKVLLYDKKNLQILKACLTRHWQNLKVQISCKGCFL